MARRKRTRRPGPDVASVAVLALVVVLAWLVLGWSPLGFGLTVVGVVFVMTGIEKVLFRAGRGGRR
jgi:hypothetical protein